MRFILLALPVFISSCTSPGRLKHLARHGIEHQNQRNTITVSERSGAPLAVQYTGCGGLYLVGPGTSIWIDPFFSHQKTMRIVASVFGGGPKGKRKFRSDPEMIDIGMKGIQEISGEIPTLDVILSAHSHYDHLMDVPAIYEK